MKKLAVIASGWHYASQFYESMAMQTIPENLHVDLFVISHRCPEDENTINEKQDARNYSGNDFFHILDKQLYEHVITKQDLINLKWHYIEKPNTIGDMEVFNQWSEDYDYTLYDVFLITHDDNLILNTNLFVDIFSSNMPLLKPIANSRYGVGNHQFKTETVTNDLEWMFLDNGYSEYIPKAFTPRGSFSFYTRDLIDRLPDNKFSMEGISVTRVGKTNSVSHHEIAGWNTNAGNFRNFLYSDDLIDKTRWLSNTKRVSKYCIEGERGFIHNNNSGETHYFSAVKSIFL
jgi:hypothetical protein